MRNRNNPRKRRTRKQSTMTTLTIAGDGKLKFAGAYHIDDLVGTIEQTESFEVSYRTACPFEGVIDGAFDACTSMPLDFVGLAIVVERVLALHTNRDEVTRYFDRDIARAINACTTAGESF